MGILYAFDRERVDVHLASGSWSRCWSNGRLPSRGSSRTAPAGTPAERTACFIDCLLDKDLRSDQFELLETPALLLDEARMMRNVARMRSRMDRLGVAFRPHVKTSKCLESSRGRWRRARAALRYPR
jgi:hypothetical protein